MSTTQTPATDAVERAYREGWLSGLALSALSVGVVSFISLLGLEKALLALTLGWLVTRQASRISVARKRALIAIIVALAYIVCWVVAAIVFRETILEFIQLLQRLS